MKFVRVGLSRAIKKRLYVQNRIRIDNRVRENHHTLLSPELTTVNRFDMNDQLAWQVGYSSTQANALNLVRSSITETETKGWHFTDIETFQRLISRRYPELRKRQVIATLNIADHTARGNAPLHQNLIERTYLGRTEMMDLVNFREYVGSEHRIRAVANTRSQRWVVFALRLPISSSDFTELSQSNANIGLWFKNCRPIHIRGRFVPGQRMDRRRSA